MTRIAHEPNDRVEGFIDPGVTAPARDAGDPAIAIGFIDPLRVERRLVTVRPPADLPEAAALLARLRRGAPR